MAGLDVVENTMEVRKKIGYLPENVPLYGDMTVLEYLLFVAEIKAVPRSKRIAEIGGAIEACKLETVQNRFIKKLSKGFRQRVGLAQALIGNPDILILDEPTIGLDPRQINEIRNLIKSFAGEKTVILSTHILPEVSMTCQRVVIINQGLVAAEDTPDNLSAGLSGLGRVKLRIFGPKDEIMSGLAQVEGVRQVGEDHEENVYLVEADAEARPRLAGRICEAGWDLYEMTPLTATLEDVFLEIVTTEKEPAVVESQTEEADEDE